MLTVSLPKMALGGRTAGAVKKACWPGGRADPVPSLLLAALGRWGSRLSHGASSQAAMGAILRRKGRCWRVPAAHGDPRGISALSRSRLFFPTETSWSLSV